MIFIPSPNSIMRQGYFVAANYHNHCSLLCTSEESLPLPTRLTNNDSVARPMNEYWP